MNRPEIFEAVRVAFDRGRWVLMTGADGSPREITLDLVERDDDGFDDEIEITGTEMVADRIRTESGAFVHVQRPADAPTADFECLGDMRLANVTLTAGDGRSWSLHPDAPSHHSGPVPSDDHGPAIPAQDVFPDGSAFATDTGPRVYEFAVGDITHGPLHETLATVELEDAPDQAAVAAADWVHVYDRVTRERRTLKRPPADRILTGLRDVAADLRAKSAPYVGQSITVTDARGVVGPGVITSADADGFKVDVLFRHTDSSDDTVDRYEWFFLSRHMSGDYGLKLEWKPFDAAAAHKRGAPVDPPFGCAPMPPVGPLTSTDGLKPGDVLRVINADGFLREKHGLTNGSVVTVKWSDSRFVDVHQAPDGGSLARRFAFVARPGVWMPWEGGENPVPGMRVQVKNCAGMEIPGDRTSEMTAWDGPSACTAYMVIDTPPAASDT